MPMTDALPETANTWTELWLAQCERDPAAPALLSAVPGQMGLWSRRELEQRIEAWARRLRECGIGAGDSVAVLLPRGPALVSAWLSLQRLGAAFVPLDPAYPAARQQLILNDAAVVALLSDAEQAELLPPGVACIDVSAWGEGLPAGESAAAVLTHPEQLAYRLYTSGSTGRPKGVLVGQRGLATLVRAQAEAFDLGPGDRVLQFASPGFDAAVAETLVSLGAGATLVLAPQAELMPGEALARTAQHLAITAMTLPPSALAVTARRQSGDRAQPGRCRRGLPGAAGGALVGRAAHGQCLWADRGHRLRQRQRPLERGADAADWLPVARLRGAAA